MTKTLELYLEAPNALKLRQTASLPAPKDNEVKLRIIYGGICGSDLRVYKGLISYAQYPLRPGHEVVGTIVEAGKGTSLQTGTKAVVFPNTYCDKCELCTSGRTNVCREKQPLGVAIDGVYAQEVLIDAKYAVPVPAELPDERAVLVEPFSVTVHALKKANIHKGTTVAVVGGGTEGLLAVALALKLGAAVTVIDINPAKWAIAKRLGDVVTMHPEDVKDSTFDVVIEAAGVRPAIEQAVQIVKPGGVMIALGITGDPVSLVPIQIVRNEISIFGSIIYTMQDFKDAINYLGDPSFNIEPIVSKIVPFTKFQEAFDDALSGNNAKIVMAFNS